MPQTSKQRHRTSENEKNLIFSNTLELARLRVDEVSKNLYADIENGLNNREVKWRQYKYGFNEVSSDPPQPIWKRYLLNFKDPLIIMLMFSAIISLIWQNYMDAVSISIAILLVVTFAFIQEYRSEMSLKALKQLMPPSCTVRRNGKDSVIMARELVAGDIVVLSTGDRVPADIRIYESTQLNIDESSFTGETKPQTKNLETVERELTSSDYALLNNIAFMGTLVISGNGKGIVANCGDRSEFGEIFRMMQNAEAPQTPLRKAMHLLGLQLAIFALFIIIIIAFVGVIQGRKVQTMFNTAVSLAVAAIPEGLPVVVTVTLALGVIRMAKRNVVIKKLPAVETLGCVNVICSDKTGTLTKNEMTVTIIITSEKIIADVTGAGFSTEGIVIIRDINTDDISSYTYSNRKSNSNDYVKQLLEIGAICNNAKLLEGKLIGKPTEGAILVAAYKMGLKDIGDMYERLDEEAFSSLTKYMAVACIRKDDPNAMPIIYMKGAIEIIMKNCTYFMEDGIPQRLNEDTRKHFITLSTELGSQGLRVLAFAKGKTMNEMTFCGLLGITDPPRPMVGKAIKLLRDSGVRVIMITGDAQETAIAIARQIGIISISPTALPGNVFDEMDDTECERAVIGVNVFYRVTPRHKLTIVKALQRLNYIVAMTGDGVNDSAALKKADIGIAMGQNGTDVCKEAADMILLDDDFLTIIAAVEEGKAIYLNIRNFVRFQMTISLSALSLIALSIFANRAAPLTATQILVINIIMDGPPAQALGVEPIEKNIMTRKPRNVKKPMITRLLMAIVFIEAWVITGISAYVSFTENDKRPNSHYATTMVFASFVFSSFFQALSCRSNIKSIFTLGVFTNRFLITAVLFSFTVVLIMIYTPYVQTIFNTESLNFFDLVYVFALSAIVLIFTEIRKLIARQLIRVIEINRSMKRPPVILPVEEPRREDLRTSILTLRSSSESYFAI